MVARIPVHNPATWSVKVKSYWCRGPALPNLGDELTAIIMERIFNITLEHESLASADLVGVGSVLGWVWEPARNLKRTAPLHVVGSGFMTPEVRL